MHRKIALAVLVCLSRAAWAADPQPYEVHIAPTGVAALDAAIAGSLQLNTLRRKAPAGPFALVARARDDVGRVRTALDSFGYYQGKITISIDGHGLDDATLPDQIQAVPAGRSVTVAVAIDKGALFHVRHVALLGAVPGAGRAAFHLREGDPAVASDVLAAGAAVLNGLQEDGYAFAKVDPPVAVERPGAHALDVSFKVVAGPRVEIGHITISGLKRVHDSYVRRRLLVKQGQLYQPSRIEAARQDLASVGVFSGVTVHGADAPDALGQVPLDFDVEERKRHAVTFTAAYSTDLGASFGTTFTYRNVFGNAEQLNLGAAITGLGGGVTQGAGYDVTAQLTKPDFYARDQQIEFDLGAIKQNLEAYDQTQILPLMDWKHRFDSRAGADCSAGRNQGLHAGGRAADGEI
jgi:translocation and assembly module TamA